MSALPAVLVAGIGNVFFGDDAFGVEVVRRLHARGSLPDGARVVDFGVRGIDLAFALSSGIDAAILVDATRRGGAPGTLYVLEPFELALGPTLDPHAMDPVRAIEFAQTLGPLPRMLRVVACEASPACDEEDAALEGLSAPVAAAVDAACDLVCELARALVPTPTPGEVTRA